MAYDKTKAPKRGLFDNDKAILCSNYGLVP